MTREEAWNRIDVIIEKHEVDDMYVTITNVSDYDALRYARKALEQEPIILKVNEKQLEKLIHDNLLCVAMAEPKTDGDCISRQAVLNIIDSYSNSQSNVEDVTQDCISDVIALPSIPQEPKTGYWIWCVGSHKCSNCEKYTCFSHKEMLRYCPNCGARMSEVEE